MRKKTKILLFITVSILLINIPSVLAPSYFDSTVSGKFPNHPSYYIWVLHMTTRLYPTVPRVEGKMQFILQSAFWELSEVKADYAYLWIDCDNGGAESNTLNIDSVVQWGDSNLLVTITFSIEPEITSDTMYSTTLYLKLVYVVSGHINTRYIHNQNLFIKVGSVYYAYSSGFCVTKYTPTNRYI